MTGLITRFFNVARFFGVGSALLLGLWLATTITAPAQTFKTLADFNGTNGASPLHVSLVPGRDGNYYGTTSLGGTQDEGTVFKITPAGKLVTLYSFCAQSLCGDGSSPYAGLVLATNGNFYGTTFYGGGSYYVGTVFKITPSGTLTTLHTFGVADGSDPEDPLVQATDGNFYGTTETGGTYLYGTIFKITPAGVLTTLHNFDGDDGEFPIAGLIQATDGNLYGTTSAGSSNYGTVFKMTLGGKFTTIYRFTDLADTEAGLVQGTDGNFYGATSEGGYYGLYGTIFKITPSGSLTTLYKFCTSGPPCTDGANPNSGLIQATDGNFYGTTLHGGNQNCSYGCGTVFQINSKKGTLTTLHSFNQSDGEYPDGGVFQATNGALYGTTEQGGAYGSGTVYGLSIGLGPFVSLLPPTGKVGQNVGIFGKKLTATSDVSFNGTSAKFSVKSDTYLTATVPQGATTGFVTVTTQGGKLKSNKKFRVRQ